MRASWPRSRRLAARRRSSRCCTTRGALGKWLESQSDEFLAERVTFPSGMTPPTKTRFEMLLGSKDRNASPAGQLMLIERMVGIVPHLTRRCRSAWLRRPAVRHVKFCIRFTDYKRDRIQLVQGLADCWVTDDEKVAGNLCFL